MGYQQRVTLFSLPLGPDSFATVSYGGKLTKKRIDKMIDYLRLVMECFPDDDEIVSIPASVDYSKLPADIIDKWIVVHRDQRVMGRGSTPDEAMDNDGFVDGDDSIILIKNPNYGGEETS